jgi:hypothetical protein
VVTLGRNAQVNQGPEVNGDEFATLKEELCLLFDTWG